MALNIAQINAANSGRELVHLLIAELSIWFPPEVRQDKKIFISRLRAAPRGLRAMGSTFLLDTSAMTQDLAWCFLNHLNPDLYEETLWGLRELGAADRAQIFTEAFSIIMPNLPQALEVAKRHGVQAIPAWLKQSGVQARIDPLNERMRKILDEWRDYPPTHYWVVYARRHPDRCVIA
jgi:hypothetical protein